MANIKDFEKNLKKIEEIAELLESGNCSLDKSLSAYSEAAMLIKSCASMLDNAENKIKILSGAENGVPTFSNFDIESENNNAELEE